MEIQKGLFNRKYLVANYGEKLGPFSDIEKADYGYIVWQKGKCGFVTESGIQTLECKYDKIREEYYKGGYFVKENGCWGYRAMDGREVLPSKYADIEANNDGFLLTFHDASSGIRKGLTSYNGEILVPCEYSDVIKIGQGFIVSSADNEMPQLFQVISRGYYKDGKEIIPCNYKQIKEGGEYIIAQDLNDNYTVFNMEGEQILPKSYKEILSINNGFIVQGERFGVYDKNGKVIIPEKYDNIEQLGDGFRVTRNHNYSCGYFNSEGKQIIPFEYESIKTVGDGFKVVKKRVKVYLDESAMTVYECGILNNDGKVVIPPSEKYKDIKSSKYGYVCYLDDGKRMVKDSTARDYYSKDGKLVLESDPHNPITKIEEKNGFIAYRTQEGWSFITKKCYKDVTGNGKKAVLSDEEKDTLDLLLSTEIEYLPNVLKECINAENSGDYFALYSFLAGCQVQDKIDECENEEEIAKATEEYSEISKLVIERATEIAKEKANKQSQQEKIEKVRKEAAESLLQIHNKTAQNIMNISKEGENE